MRLKSAQLGRKGELAYYEEWSRGQAEYLSIGRGSSGASARKNHFLLNSVGRFVKELLGFFRV